MAKAQLPSIWAFSGLVTVGSSLYSAYQSYISYDGCKSSYISQDPDDVKKLLNSAWKQKVFGQDLALKVIRNMLVSHFKRVVTGKSKKPLVMSFHGGMGTGKSFVSALLANILYKEGESSNSVRRLHLVDMLGNARTIDEKRNAIKNEIKSIVKSCSRSLIIFEEIDKVEKGVIDVLYSYFDQFHSLGNVDFRNAIFIFSSNAGTREINHEACVQFNKTDQRSDFNVEQFYHIVRQASYDGQPHQQSSSQSSFHSGFNRATFIKHFLVSTFVPFLPLEMKHVLQCMEASLAERDEITMKLRNHPELKKEFLSLIYSLISTVNPPGCIKKFSINGCKRVSHLVDQEADSFFYSNY